MHITYDLSIGSIITLLATLGGFLVAAGRMTALLSQTSTALAGFRDVFQRHVEDDVRRFEQVGNAVQDVALKMAAMSATLATLVTLKTDKE